MSFSAVVDVVIGLALVYLAISLLVTVINEYVAQTLELRGRALARSLQSLIDHPPIAAALQRTRTLGALMGAPGKRPSYVDPAVFVGELLGAVAPSAAGAAPGNSALQQIVASINLLPSGQLKTALLGIAAGVDDSVEEFKKSAERWLDRSLTMLGEAYKRELQLISLGIGLVLAGVFNVDTIHLTQRLYDDAVLRGQVVSFAEGFAAQANADLIKQCTAPDRRAAAPMPPAASETATGKVDIPATGSASALLVARPVNGTASAERSGVKADSAPTGGASSSGASCAPVRNLMDLVSAHENAQLELPIGWDAQNKSNAALMVLGWLLTALAISLGATFWFDLLSKLINVRYGMSKPRPLARQQG